jgi:hypothetical protein
LVGHGHCLILRYCPGIRLEELRRTTKNLNQDIRSLEPRFEPGTSRYEASVLNTRTWRSVTRVCYKYVTIVQNISSRGSSVSIVSDYGVRSPAGAKSFSSILCVQTGSGAHPASCRVGTGGPFPGGKARPGRDAGHSPPSSAEVKNE